jgi:hypothetical protein
MLQLKLLPEVRTLLNGAFRLVDFIRMDFTFTLSTQSKDLDLLDFELHELVKDKVAASPTNAQIALSNPELVYLYTAVDILCKSYFGPLGDFLKAEQLKLTSATEQDYVTSRSQNLKVADRFLEHLSRTVSSYKGFNEVRDKLEQLEQTMN